MKTILTKPLSVFLLGFFAAFGVVYVLCKTNSMPFDCCSNNGNVDIDLPRVELNDSQGVVIKKDSADYLMAQYQSVISGVNPQALQESNGSKGGSISVLALQNLINETDPNQPELSYINFRFGYFPPKLRANGTIVGDISLILSASSLNPENQPSTNQYIIRTSGPAGFCPTRCY